MFTYSKSALPPTSLSPVRGLIPSADLQSIADSFLWRFAPAAESRGQILHIPYRKPIERFFHVFFGNFFRGVFFGG